MKKRINAKTNQHQIQKVAQESKNRKPQTPGKLTDHKQTNWQRNIEKVDYTHKGD